MIIPIILILFVFIIIYISTQKSDVQSVKYNDVEIDSKSDDDRINKQEIILTNTVLLLNSIYRENFAEYIQNLYLTALKFSDFKGLTLMDANNISRAFSSNNYFTQVSDIQLGSKGIVEKENEQLHVILPISIKGVAMRNSFFFDDRVFDDTFTYTDIIGSVHIRYNLKNEQCYLDNLIISDIGNVFAEHPQSELVLFFMKENKQSIIKQINNQVKYILDTPKMSLHDKFNPRLKPLYDEIIILSK
jgi:hypothetical protein